MSINLFAYLDAAPSLDDMCIALTPLGLIYRHTLPADERWNYPMHVFGRAELRIVYHAGDPARGEAMVDGSTGHNDQQAVVAIQMVMTALVRRYGGTICDPQVLGRNAVL